MAVLPAFTDSVDRSFDLIGPVQNGGKGIGRRHAQIVMAVRAQLPSRYPEHFPSSI